MVEPLLKIITLHGTRAIREVLLFRRKEGVQNHHRLTSALAKCLESVNYFC